jgi:hypothetical protein
MTRTVEKPKAISRPDPVKVYKYRGTIRCRSEGALGPNATNAQQHQEWVDGRLRFVEEWSSEAREEERVSKERNI